MSFRCMRWPGTSPFTALVDAALALRGDGEDQTAYSCGTAAGDGGERGEAPLPYH
jgi:hypothetical protein